MQDRAVTRVAPQLAQIVEQGVREGVFDTPIPDRAGELALRFASALSERSAHLLLKLKDRPEVIADIRQLFDDVEYGMERIIGAPDGTISMLDREALQQLMETVVEPERSME